MFFAVSSPNASRLLREQHVSYTCEKRSSFRRLRPCPRKAKMHLDCEHPPVKEVLSNIHCVAVYIKCDDNKQLVNSVTANIVSKVCPLLY